MAYTGSSMGCFNTLEAPWLSQLRLNTALLGQHAPPPGRALQPSPPHMPQLAGQQNQLLLTATTPVAQAGSGTTDAVGASVLSGFGAGLVTLDATGLHRLCTVSRSSALTAFVHCVALAHLSIAPNDPVLPLPAQTTELSASTLNAIEHTPNATASHPGVVSGVGTRLGDSAAVVGLVALDAGRTAEGACGTRPV